MSNILNIWDANTQQYVGIPAIKGDSGVHYGTSEPTDPSHPVWIDPSGEGDALSGGTEQWKFLDEVSLRTDTLQYNWAKTKDYKKLMLICDNRAYNSELSGTIWFNTINSTGYRSFCSFAKQAKSVFVYQFENGFLSYSSYESNNLQTMTNRVFCERAYLPDYVITDNDYYNTTFPESALDGTGTVKVFGVRR